VESQSADTIMKEIFLSFIKDVKARNRHAHTNLILALERYGAQLRPDQQNELLERILSFSNRYEKAWWWNKNKVIAETLSSL
jgi:hypothetical protein